MSTQDEYKNQENKNAQYALKANAKLFGAITLLCLVALVVLLAFSGNQRVMAIDDERLMVVQNTRVQAMPLSIQSAYIKPRSVYGQIEALQQSDIGFELSGTLRELHVLEGAYVQKDEILAQLDVARLLSRKSELNSALKHAQANANLAQLSHQRVSELVRDNLEPQQRLDESQAQLDAAKALLSEVEARLNSLEVEISKSSLKAPYEGQIVRKYFDAGTVVGAGQAVFSIIAKTSLEARFGLPEQTAFELQIDTQYILNIQGTSFPATAKSVAKQRNIATRTIDAVFSINIDDLSEQQRQSIVAGDLVSLNIDIHQKKTGAWIPVSALAAGVRGMWTLYVISDNNQIETRMVSIEFADENNAYVSGAINSDERVVVSGIHRLTPKQKVNNIELVTLLEDK